MQKREKPQSDRKSSKPTFTPSGTGNSDGGVATTLQEIDELLESTRQDLTYEIRGGRCGC